MSSRASARIRLAVASNTSAAAVVTTTASTSTSSSSSSSTLTSKRKKQTQSKRKRVSSKKGTQQQEEGEDDEEMREGKEQLEEEKANEEVDEKDEEETKRVNKKTKRVTKKQAQVEDEVTTPVISSFTTTTTTNSSSSSHSFISPALRCDSDSLSLVFSFLTTREFMSALRVSHQWTNVAQLPSAWPRYSLESMTSQFRRVDHLRSIDASIVDQHRDIKASNLKPMLIRGQTKSIARNITSLSIEKQGFNFRPLTHANFPHLTQLSCTDEQLDLDADTLMSQIRVLKLKTTYLPDMAILFTQLRVLSLNSHHIDDASLVQLHQLEYFRSETAYLMKARVTRVLRYLSVRHSLRSLVFVMSHEDFIYDIFGNRRLRPLQTRGLDALLITPWKETIELAQQEIAELVQWQLGFRKKYDDPIPDEEAGADLPPAILHEFEYFRPVYDTTGDITQAHLSCLLAMPNLKRLTWPLVGYMTIQSITDTHSDAFSQQVEHLSLSFLSSDVRDGFHLLTRCHNLCTLNLTFDSFTPKNLDWLTQLPRMGELTLNFGKDADKFKVAKSWVFLKSMMSLRKFDLSIYADKSFPLGPIAINLGSLPLFVRFGFRLPHQFFLLDPKFLTGLCSSSTWTQCHVVIPSEYRHDHALFDTGTGVPRLKTEALNSPALTRFRVHRHIEQNEEKSVSSTHYIRVLPPSGEGDRLRAEWVKVEADTDSKHK